MLLELRVRDFAVIDTVTVHLGSGLNVLTGETGAGKSILVGALSLLLGERASSESVRAGAEKAVVEAVFDAEGLDGITAALEESGFELEDGLLILRREVWKEGRNRAWVNGSPAPAGVVGAFGRLLVDLHGQHEHQTLLRPAEQRTIVDAYAGSSDLATAVRDLYGQSRTLAEEREHRIERQGELEAQADFLRFQLREIEDAAPGDGEDRELDEEGRRLEHSGELSRGSDHLHEELYAGEAALSDRLAHLRDVAEELARIDPELEGSHRELDELYHRTTEIGRTFASYAASVEHDPDRLEEIRARLDLLARLKRKYGPELNDVKSTAEELRGKLGTIDAQQVDLENLDERLSRTRAALDEAARSLSEKRREAASRLQEAVERMLPDLGMTDAVFRVSLEELKEVGGGGRERVEFLVSLNAGFDPRSLARIASGGELSRVMLALKATLAREDRVSTLVFDEIDAGIGGAVATRVAERLVDVARHHQVLVITHLAQLASRGNVHLHVTKGARDGVAAVELHPVEGEARVAEVARLLGGDPESATSRDHARELLHASPA